MSAVLLVGGKKVGGIKKLGCKKKDLEVKKKLEVKKEKVGSKKNIGSKEIKVGSKKKRGSVKISWKWKKAGSEKKSWKWKKKKLELKKIEEVKNIDCRSKTILMESVTFRAIVHFPMSLVTTFLKIKDYNIWEKLFSVISRKYSNYQDSCFSANDVNTEAASGDVL